MGEWNEVDLEFPVPIDMTFNYLVGFAVELPAQTFAIGADCGPNVEGGDEILYNGYWISYKEFTRGESDLNWNIQTYCIGTTDTEAMPVTERLITEDEPANRIKPEDLKCVARPESTKAVESTELDLDITYNVWRMKSADKEDASKWLLMTPEATTDTCLIDNEWKSLDKDDYQYAVVAVYDNQFYSDTLFTEKLSKGNVSVFDLKVTANNGASLEGASVQLKSITGYDRYSKLLDADGKANFAYINKGTYAVTVSKTDFHTLETEVVIADDYESLYTLVLEEIKDVPVNLTAEWVSNGALLNWQVPGSYSPTEGWIYWDNGEILAGFGNMEEQLCFDVAHKYTGEELKELGAKDLYITKIAFFPCTDEEYESEAYFTVKIWEIKNDAPVLVYSQYVDEYSINYNEMNEILLDQPYYLDGEKTILVGYEVDLEQGYVAGLDAGPVVDGKGNLIRYEGSWYALTELNNSYTYNWLIHAYCSALSDEEVAATEIALDLQPERAAKVSNTKPAIGNMVKPEVSASVLQHKKVAASVESAYVTGYNLYRFAARDANVEGAWRAVNTEVIADTTFVDTEILSLEKDLYQYALKAVYASGESEPIFSNSIDSSNATGISDLTDNNEVVITPNPNNGIFTVIMEREGNMDIYDMTGSRCHTQTMSEGSNAVSVNLPAGHYIIVVKADNQESSHRLLISK